MKLKLISFVVCPYVQRAVITLKHSNTPFDIEYIDLKNKPDWFLKLSPLGKVPVLVVNDKDVIFESAVINELVDELSRATTLSKDPVEKAKERAWIAYSDSLFTDLYGAINSGNFEIHAEKLLDKLTLLNNVISDSGFFKSSGFSIIDSAYAPCFFRMQKFEYFAQSPRLMGMKKIRKWIENLSSQEYVKNSVRADFDEAFAKYVSAQNSAVKLVSINNCVI